MAITNQWLFIHLSFHYNSYLNHYYCCSDYIIVDGQESLLKTAPPRASIDISSLFLHFSISGIHNNNNNNNNETNNDHKEEEQEEQKSVTHWHHQNDQQKVYRWKRERRKKIDADHLRYYHLNLLVYAAIYCRRANKQKIKLDGARDGEANGTNASESLLQ